MRDIDHGHVLFLEAGHNLEQGVDLRPAHTGGGFIKKQDFSVDGKGLHDFDNALLSQAKRSYEHPGINLDAKALQKRVAVGIKLTAFTIANRRCGRFIAQKNVFRNSKRINQAQFLIDRSDTLFARINGIGD